MPSFLSSVLSIALVALQVNGSAAFSPVPGRISFNRGSVTARAVRRPPEIEKIVTEDMRTSYGENSRAYRRTVYSHADWQKHR